MSNLEANKDVARAFFRALAERDEAGIDRILSDDIEYWMIGEGPVGGFKTKAEIMHDIKAYLWQGMVGSPTIHIDEMTAEDDRIAILGRGQMETVAGKEYNNVYSITYWVRDGKIVKSREFFDTAYLGKVFF